MRWLCFFVVIFFAASANTGQPDAKPVTIPLKDIWAFQMPDTRSVRELEEVPARAGYGTFVYEILSALGSAKTADAFVVPGTPSDALQNAHAILVKGTNVTLSSGDEVSVIFFSYQFDNYVHITQVERIGNTIKIHYRFVPHFSKELTSHFAIIPLGKLSKGKYQVEILNDPMEKKYSDFKPISKEWIDKIICKPFSFLIE